MAECSRRTDVLLEGNYAIYPKLTVKYHVLVTNSQIFYVPCMNCQEPSASKKSSEHVLKFLDVIGADCMRGKTAASSVSYLNIYAYQHQKKFASKDTVRKRHCITFVFADFPSYEENHKDASQWQLVMTYLIRRIEVKLEGTSNGSLNLTSLLMSVFTISK